MTASPAPPWRPFIDGYVGYRLVGFPSGLHRGLPSRHLTFIVSIGAPIHVVSQTDPRQPPDRYGVVLSGLQATSALIANEGRQEGVAIELTPVGCRALLGLPARALWNISLEADQVLGPVAVELRERLHAVSSWAGRFQVCDEVLGRLRHERRPAPPGVVTAWRLTVASAGSLSVAAVAEETGWSRRHLAQRFRDEFGLSPKLAARIVRFEHARRMLQAKRRTTIAEVAATCGYYDQPHLTREFVEMAGCPPGEWLATDLPSVQDDELLETSTSGP